MQPLKGRTALVTGAARGIGRGIVEVFAAAGANVVINYLDDAHEAQGVADKVAELGGEAIIVQGDISDRAAVERLFTAAVERFGRVDIAVANAALSVREPVLEAKWENVLRTLEVTQFGTFHTCQFAAQQMVRQGKAPNGNGGKIIIIGSVHAEVGFPNAAAYNMAKAAVNHLARTMAAELSSHKININVINPGWVNTPGELTFYTVEQLEKAGERIPWGRIGRPQDIGQAALYLASDAADYVTGSVLRVDGGYNIGLTLPAE